MSDVAIATTDVGRSKHDVTCTTRQVVCTTCRFWLRRRTGYGECRMVDTAEGKAWVDASANDDSGLSAWLMTREDFFCALHESKEDDNV